MKRLGNEWIVSAVVLCLVAGVADLHAEQKVDVELQIASAVAAAPEAHREDATVAARGEGGKLTVLREGLGDLMCLADEPGNETFHSACYHKSLEDYMRRGRELKAEGVTGQDRHDRRHQEAEEGKIKMPDGAASVYTLIGKEADFNPATGKMRGALHVYAVYIPYATPETTGLPIKPNPDEPSQPWLMRAGTPSAHIMITPGPSTDDADEEDDDSGSE